MLPRYLNIRFSLKLNAIAGCLGVVASNEIARVVATPFAPRATARRRFLSVCSSPRKRAEFAKGKKFRDEEVANRIRTLKHRMFVFRRGIRKNVRWLVRINWNKSFFDYIRVRGEDVNYPRFYRNLMVCEKGEWD